MRLFHHVSNSTASFRRKRQKRLVSNTCHTKQTQKNSRFLFQFDVMTLNIYCCFHFFRGKNIHGFLRCHLEWHVLLNSLKTEESVLTYGANTGEWWEGRVCIYGSNIGEMQATTMSLEEVEAAFFVRSLAHLSRHFFAASPQALRTLCIPCGQFLKFADSREHGSLSSVTLQPSAHCKPFVFRFQGPAHSFIPGSCCIEKIEQCGIRVEPHQKSAYSQMNST